MSGLFWNADGLEIATVPFQAHFFTAILISSCRLKCFTGIQYS